MGYIRSCSASFSLLALNLSNSVWLVWERITVSMYICGKPGALISCSWATVIST